MPLNQMFITIKAHDFKILNLYQCREIVSTAWNKSIFSNNFSMNHQKVYTILLE